MRTAVLIPSRNDRPDFLANCLRMMQAQTLQPYHIEIVDDKALSNEKDITWRYRIGYDRLRNKCFDVIALIENDDWYSPNYLEYMVQQWIDAGKPVLFGTDYTIYYHLKEQAYFTMNHDDRASAMNTLIRPDFYFNWCKDNDPYTDIHLWHHAGTTQKIIHPDKHYSIGMKHGIGLCGGRNHIDKLDRFKNKDTNSSFLHKHIVEIANDIDSFNFYSNFK